jgi:hypothetical protein
LNWQTEAAYKYLTAEHIVEMYEASDRAWESCQVSLSVCPRQLRTSRTMQGFLPDAISPNPLKVRALSLWESFIKASLEQVNYRTLARAFLLDVEDEATEPGKSADEGTATMTIQLRRLFILPGSRMLR